MIRTEVNLANGIANQWIGVSDGTEEFRDEMQEQDVLVDACRKPGRYLAFLFVRSVTELLLYAAVVVAYPEWARKYLSG
jgi:hypothetical protein